MKSTETLIDEGIVRTRGFYKSSNGNPYLWLSSHGTTFTDDGFRSAHILSFEAKTQERGVKDYLVLALPMDEYSFDDFIEIVHGIEDYFNFPLLVHDYPREKVLKMRECFDQHVREDVVM